MAAAELALAVEKHVLESGSIDTVGTVGMSFTRVLFIELIDLKFHLDWRVRNMVCCFLFMSINVFMSKGKLDLHPGAINSIPSKAHIEIGKKLLK